MFKSGQSGNPSGRKVGSENKETKTIRTWIAKFLEGNLSQLEEDINSLDAKDRVKAICDLMEYSVPKLARVENLNDNSGEISIKIIRE